METDVDGAYRFDGLPMVDGNDKPYLYRVRSYMPDGKEWVAINVGSDENNDSDWGEAAHSGVGAGGRGGLCRSGRLLPAAGFFRGRGVFLSAGIGRLRASGFACRSLLLAVAGDFGYRPAAPVQAVEFADDLFGIAERDAHEREVVRDLDVVDVFVAQAAFEFEHIDQLARRVAVAPAHGEEQPRRPLAVHRERTDFGVVVLVEFAAERQTQ